MGSYLKHVARY